MKQTKTKTIKLLPVIMIALGAMLISYSLMNGMFINNISDGNKEDIITDNFINANAKIVVEKSISDPKVSLLFDTGDVFDYQDTDYRYSLENEKGEIIADNSVFLGDTLDTTITHYTVEKYAIVSGNNTEYGYNILNEQTGDIIKTVDENKTSDYLLRYDSVNIVNPENKVSGLNIENSKNRSNSRSRNTSETNYYKEDVGILSVTGAYVDTMVDSKDNYIAFTNFMDFTAPFRGVLFIIGVTSLLFGLFIASKSKTYLSKFDKIPTDIFLISSFAIIRLCVSISSRQMIYFSSLVSEFALQNIMVGLISILAPLIFGYTVYALISMVRQRIDQKTFIVNSLTYKLYTKIKHSYKKYKESKDLKSA